jgi:hypothetical protein
MCNDHFSLAKLFCSTPGATQLHMAYIVIKTINGRQCRYQQRAYRQGGKVRTETIYLGPVDGGKQRQGVLRRVNAFLETKFPPRHGLPDEEVMLRQYNEKVEREGKEREKAIVRLHDLYGLGLFDTPPSIAPNHQGNAPAEETSTDFNAQMPTSESGTGGGFDISLAGTEISP